MSTTNHINLCLQSKGTEDDWKDLYEASFPLDERMPVPEVRTLLSSGTMLLHKTTDAQGGLQCFSLVTILSNFVLLAYIATDQTKRSSGVGSKHMKALIDLLKKLYPTYLGLFLEIESTKEKNLSIDEDKARKRRLAFYQRLHCKRMLGKEYLLPSYAPGIAARQGELLWFEFGSPVTGDASLKAVISEIYTRAYNTSTSDPAYIKVVGQFSATTVPAAVPPADPAAVPAAVPAAAPAVAPPPPATVPAAVHAATTTPISTTSATGGAAGRSDTKTASTPATADAPAHEPTVEPAKDSESGAKS